MNMTWDDDRDFVDDYVDGLTSGLGTGIASGALLAKATTPPAATPAPAPTMPASFASFPPLVSPTPPASPSVVFHTPLSATSLAAKSLIPSTTAAKVLQAAAAQTGAAVLSTPGVLPHVETPPVAGDLTSRLAAIHGSLLAMRAQAEATSQHRSMMNRDDFRKSVIARLARIEARLPSTSPAADQLRSIRVLLG